jgi:DNA-binding NarL/FixJ family response regulator
MILTGSDLYMVAKERQQPNLVLSPKTCARCGQVRPEGEAFACPTCKQPALEGGDAILMLSLRERQIVQLIQQAKTNKEIAYELSLTVGTVKEYVYHIFRKLGVTNRTELALWGRT